MTLLRPAAVAEQRYRLYGRVRVPCRAPFLATACAVLALLVGVGHVAVTTRYTERQHVRGYLMPEHGIAHVRAPRPGVVDRVYASFDTRVERGTPLVRIATESGLDSGATLGAAVAANLERRRDVLADRTDLERARLAQALDSARGERKSLLAEAELIDAQIATQRRWLDATAQRLDAYRRATVTGSVPALESKRLEGEMLSGELQLQALERQRVALRADIARSDERANALVADHRTALTALELNRVDLEDRALDNDRSTALIVTAPMDGVVISLAALPGAEVAAGKELMVLAPADARLLAQAFVPVDAIGFVARGDRVAIQYDSFPHRDYGEFGGSIVEVSEFVFDRRDLEVELGIQQPVFRVLIALDAMAVEVNGSAIALKPGMTFDAHVATRTLTVAEWVFEPLLRLRDAPFDR